MIDLLAPDIYLEGSERVLKVIELYNRPDNTLFVPEAGLSLQNSKYLYEVIARGGIGFSPFGIDGNKETPLENETIKGLEPFGLDYAMAAPMMRELAKWGYEGKIKATVEREDHAEQTISLGLWEVVVSFGGSGRGNKATPNEQPVGKAMIIQLEENNFMMMGSLCHFSFRPIGKNAGKAWQYVKVEEGHYKNGTFILSRILNGDETDWGGPRCGATPTVLRASLMVR